MSELASSSPPPQSEETPESPKKGSLRKDDDYEDDLERELESYIEEHSVEKKSEDSMEKGQKEEMAADRKEDRVSDNEDSEADDYNLTEDQKRALAELDNLKNDMGYPDEDPPEYNVKERLKVLNEDLKNDPTPVEKVKDSKVGFKSNLVDLVAPPPDFSDDEEGKDGKKSPKQSEDKDKTGDKVDDKSEQVSGQKSNTSTSGGKKDKVLIEIDGQFQLVDADDVRAKDFGLASMDSDKDKENEMRRAQLQPAPPGKPRPATASASSRRNVRVTSAKQRPQSAQQSVNHGSALDNFNYYSPYALSPREKQLMEERKKAMEKQRKEDEKKKKKDDEAKERENREAFEYWLKKKREEDRRKKILDEEERKRNNKEDRTEPEEEASAGSYDPDQYSTTSMNQESEEAFKDWLKAKHNQFKKEKLLKKRQDQEMHDGYYVRSREECDKAYRQWLKQKASDARRARALERQKAKLQRLAARRARKSITLGKSIRESNSFRYVDYYGYRF